MAWTEATLTTAIQEYVESTETTMVARIPTFIETVERNIVKATKLPVFRKNSTGTCTASTEYLATPSDFLAPFEMLVSDTGWYPVKQKDVTFLRAAYPLKTTEGRPKYYAMFDDDTFLIAPTPDSGYTMELHYLHLPTSLTSDDNSWLSDNAENCLLYGCLIEAYTFMKGDDENLLQEYKSRYGAELMLLKGEGEGYNTTDDYREETKSEARV